METNCDKPSHNQDLCSMYDLVMAGLKNSSVPFCRKRSKHYEVRPGWNDHVQIKHQQAREAFTNWVAVGRPRTGPANELKKQTERHFKYAVRCIKRTENNEDGLLGPKIVAK